MDLRKILIEKHDYKISQVDNVVKQINEFSPKVSAAFEKWLSTGEIDDTEVEGFTVKTIMEKKPMKVVAAYLTLGWLENDPKQAKRFLKESIIKNSAAEKKY